MTSYRRDPMDRELCGWGSCAQTVSPFAPLCTKHLIAAYRIVQEQIQGPH